MFATSPVTVNYDAGGELNSIYRQYWCRHCFSLRSARCVMQDVDTLFCSQCLEEHMPSTESRLNRNRCTKCHECPVCAATLSTVAAPLKADQPATFYLACGFCLWNSKEVGLQGTQEDMTKQLAELVRGPMAEPFTKALEYYQRLAAEEHRQHELRQHGAQALFRKGRLGQRFTFQRQSLIINRADCAAKVRSRVNKVYNSLSNQWEDIPEEGDRSAFRSKATKDVPALPTNFFTDPVDINTVATLEQRLRMPELQYADLRKMPPSPKDLLAKRSKRCKQCQHNLCKAELSPVSTKFKMQLFALYHVPNVKVSVLPRFTVGQEAKLILLISNPLDHAIEVVFRQVPVPSAADLSATAAAAAATAAGLPSTTTSTAAKKQSSTDIASPSPAAETSSAAAEDAHKREPAVVRPIYSNTKVRFPEEAIKIAENDPVHELSPEESTNASSQEGHSEFVIARQGHNIYIAFPVTPTQDNENVIMAFSMQYLCKTTTPAARTATATAGTSAAAAAAGASSPAPTAATATASGAAAAAATVQSETVTLSVVLDLGPLAKGA